jgi:hypothetical protein
MAVQPKKPKTWRDRVRDLFAMMGGAASPAEAETARHKLDALLKKHGKTWNDLPELLRPDETPAQATADPRDSGPHPFDRPDAPTPADTVRAMLEQYAWLEPHEYVAVALWAIHTHVFDRFMVSPRLLFSSPVKGCGKTTLLDVVARLVARAEKSDNITAAAIYYALRGMPRTLLLDEADNLEMGTKAVLRSVLNAGHRQGGVVSRMVRGLSIRFPVYAPIALAAIGTLFSQALMSRSIVVHMRRADSQTMKSLRRFDLADTADLDIVYSHVVHWLKEAKLGLDPEMPDELHGRTADNWRPLIAIADACSPAWGTLAREAAVAFARGDHDDDIAVILLRHIREVFDARDVDRIGSKDLVRELIALESADGFWGDYRGASGSERPRRLTPIAVVRLLSPFKIKPRTLWPLQRTAESKSVRGYHRTDFEAAWSSYCDENATTSQARRLHVIK